MPLDPYVSSRDPSTNGGPDEEVAVVLRTGTLHLARSAYEAVAQVWHDSRQLLPTPVDQMSARLFIGMAARSPALQGVDSAIIQALLKHACTTGEFPPVIATKPREDLAGVRRQSAALPSTERTTWLRRVYASSFAERFPALEDFLFALLDQDSLSQGRLKSTRPARTT